MQQNNRPKLILAGSIIIFLIVLVGVILASDLFHQNPYGTSTKIDNFNHYFREVPSNTRDATFAALHTTIAYNLPEDQETPISGASIRADSVTNTYNEEALATLSTFLVDLKEIQQTYQIQMNWSNNPNAEIAGYSILVTCPSADQLIYPAFDCQDMLTHDSLNNLANKYPFINNLPLIQSYYTDSGAELVHYKIEYRANEDYTDITIIITDYTGNSHERALQDLSSKFNINPAQYKIEYINDNEFSQAPAKAPSD